MSSFKMSLLVTQMKMYILKPDVLPVILKTWRFVGVPLQKLHEPVEEIVD